MLYYQKLLNNTPTEQNSFFGDLNEGRDYEDVKAQNMEYLKFLEANDLNYGRALFIPIWSGEREYDIIEYGYWPSGEEQYQRMGCIHE